MPSFIFPYILIALILIIIPFILHFVHKGKKRQIAMSSLFLFQQEMMESNRSLKFLNSLVNILRALLILIIILLLAKPLTEKEFWVWQNELNQEKVNLILLDNTLSMSYEDINFSHFDSAVDEVKKLLKDFPYQNNLSLVSLGSKLILPTKIYKNKDELLKKFPLVRIENDNFPINEKILNILEDYKKRNIKLSAVFIISDFQQSDWDNVNFPKELPLTLIKIGDVYPPNVFITKIDIKDKLYFANDEAKLDVYIKQFAKGKNKRKLSLYLDSAFVKEDEIELENDEEKKVSIYFGLNQDKWVYANLKILFDRYNVDDNYAFPIYFKRNAKILFLSHNNFPLSKESIKYSIISSDKLKHTHKWESHLKDRSDKYDCIITNRLSRLSRAEIQVLNSHIKANKPTVFILNQKDSIYRIKRTLRQLQINDIIDVRSKQIFKPELIISSNNKYQDNEISRLFKKFKNKIKVSTYFNMTYDKNQLIPLFHLNNHPFIFTSINEKKNIHIVNAGVNQENSNILFQQWFPVLMKSIFEKGLKQKLRESNFISIDSNRSLYESNLISYNFDELKKKYKRKHLMVTESVDQWLKMSQQSLKKSTLQRNSILEKIALILIIIIIFTEFIISYNIKFTRT